MSANSFTVESQVPIPAPPAAAPPPAAPPAAAPPAAAPPAAAPPAAAPPAAAPPPAAPPQREGCTAQDVTQQLETAQEWADKVRQFPFWYHRIALPGGLVTPGWAPIDPAAYQIPERLDGKRVLDIGAWDGYWTFEALRRGAREVVAIDDFSDYLGSLKEADRKAWQTFDLCRDALGYSEPQCQRHELSIYELTRDALGEFDVVFAFGLLYHLRYPLLALDLISKVCTGELYVESAILDDFSPYRGGLHHGYMGGQMVMEFYPDNQYGNNHTNWWAPTLHCLAHMVRAAGFDEINGWKLRGQPGSIAECRGFVKGVKAASFTR